MNRHVHFVACQNRNTLNSLCYVDCAVEWWNGMNKMTWNQAENKRKQL